jgi:TolA-binding protein
MAPPLNKKEMRRNPLAEWVGAVARFVELHRTAIMAAAIAVVIILGAAGAYSWYWIHQGQLARAALADAEQVLRTETPANADEAMKRLAAVAKDYRGTESAEEALIRLANLQYDVGKMDEAQKAYGDYLRTYPRGRFVLMAAIGQAYVDDSKGNYQAGAEALSRALDNAKNSPLAGEAYSELARLYEEMKKPEDAIRVYSQIVEQYGQTYWAQQAQQRLALLRSK